MTVNVTRIYLSPKQEPAPAWVVDMVIEWLKEREAERTARAHEAESIPVEIPQKQTEE